MENLFGKDFSECKDKTMLRKLFSGESFDKLLEEAKTISTSNRSQCIAESIADLSIKAMQQHDLFIYTMNPLLQRPELGKTFLFDLKFYIMASFYYGQISDNPHFDTNTNYTQAFDKYFLFRSRRREIQRKNGGYPLPQFFPKSNKPRIYRNLIDIGLVMSLFSSVHSSKNPYIRNAEQKEFNPYVFLQAFSNAFISKDDARRMLMSDVIQVAPPSCNEYGNVSPNDAKIFESVKALVHSINVKGYAVINQFLIERLTNINFIMALYEYRISGMDSEIYLESQISSLLKNWITVPLLKTRLKVLELHRNGIQMPREMQESLNNNLLRFVLPFTRGIYYYLMEYNGKSIKTNDPFFDAIYADPCKVCSDSDLKYELFTIKNNDKIDKAIRPVQQIRIYDRRILKGILLEEVKKTKDYGSKNIVGKSDDLEDICELLGKKRRSKGKTNKYSFDSNALETVLNNSSRPFLVVDLEYCSSHSRLIPDFGRFSRFCANVFNSESKTMLEDVRTLLPVLDSFDDAVNRIASLRTKVFRHPEILNALDSVYSLYSHD